LSASSRLPKTGVKLDLRKLAKFLPALVGFALPLLVHFDGLSTSGHLCLSIFLGAAFLWLLEPIPLFATAILIMLLEIVLLSKEGIVYRFFVEGRALEPDALASMGKYSGYKSFLSAISNPLIVLFLGGFALADAARKQKIDAELARLCLKPFGSNPKLILMGVLLITALFSAFMSNTACTAMMMAIVFPAIAALDPDDRFRAAIILAVPFAANIGGMATPIGTPPNAIAIGQLEALKPSIKIEFMDWVKLAAPFTLVMLGVVWAVLTFMFPPKGKVVSMTFTSTKGGGYKKWFVYVVFIITVLLWITGQWHGIPDGVVALFPLAAFTMFGILTPKEFNSMSWDILWLIAGGIALGTGMQETGLTDWMVGLVTWGNLPGWAVVTSFAVGTLLLSTFISNTATANLFVPISVGVAVSLAGSTATLEQLGATAIPLVVSTGLAASLAMALPISTPPNAIAYASGQIEQKNMARAGFAVGIIGVIVLAALVPLLWKVMGY
jgi:sodium-dependent dicarboxylate transporter 2/3/5